MIITLITIFILFSVAISTIWIWFVLNEKNAHARFYKAGINAFNKENYQTAQKQFLKVLAIDANFQDTAYWIGLTHLKLKEYSKAKDIFQKILKTSPKDYKILFNYGFSIQMLESYDEAKEIYTKALAENPKSADCYLNLGIINVKQADYTTAIGYLEQAKEILPNSVPVLFYTTRCKDEQCSYDNHEEGQVIINEYLELEGKVDLPDEFYIVLTKAYSKNGQIEKSIETCQKTLHLDSENIEGYKQLGLAQLIKKDLVGAKNSLSTAISLNPDDAEAHELLSYVLCQQKSLCAVKRCREKYHDMIKKILG